MEKRIEKAIDIFLDAINNGTLAKGDCTMCAVGNLVADKLGRDMEDSLQYANMHWRYLFYTDEKGQNFNEHSLNDKYVIKNIEATDFNVRELMAIEYAFERNAEIDVLQYSFYSKEEIRADQINGLKAVIEVMLGFTNDTETDVQEVFVNKAELIKLH